LPYQKHVAFKLPERLDTPIWRYQDLGKLLMLLQTKALHFARGDTLGDPFEGSYPRANLRTDREGPNPHGFAKAWRLKSAVNCWHLSEDESAAMWALYSRSNLGISVRSTTARFIRSIEAAPQDVFIGVVSYIDYDRTAIPENNTFYAVLHKRRSFAHEQELRAVTQFITGPGVVDLTQLPLGILVPVDVQTLVESIVVAPYAPTSYKDMLERAVHDTGYPDLQVTQSRMGEAPFF
jgi:hypothetical protein